MADVMHLTGKNSHSLTMDSGLMVDTRRVDSKTLQFYPKGFSLKIERIEEDDTVRVRTVINLSPEETVELLVLLTKEVRVHNSSEENDSYHGFEE